VVAYGLERRDLSGVVALGSRRFTWEERKFWTLVNQFDEHCKRLLWVGRESHGEDLRDVFREVSPTGLHVTRIILFVFPSSLNTSEYSSLRSLITFRLSSLSIFDQHPPMSALLC
jgi:hypothetical protein